MTTKYLAGSLMLTAVLTAAPSSAQGLDTIGSRGAAMAAFVAVADDASAVVWNPAGLVTGPTFNLLLDFAHNVHEPVTPPATGGAAANGSATLFALGTLPIGLTYYRLTATEAVSVADEPAGVGTPDRQDSQVLVRTLVTSHLGATIQQSLGSHFTLGTTVKLVRGEVGAVVRTASSWEEALETGDGFDRTASTQGDLDIGAMAYAGRFRLGVVVRNVTEPSFGPADDVETRTLARYARAGIAWGNRWTGISSTVVAFDADLTRVAAVGGERRDVAGGVEQWLARRRFGVRGGVRASTVGDVRPIVSGGGSISLRQGMYVDAYYSGGEGDVRAWGVATRLTY